MKKTLLLFMIAVCAGKINAQISSSCTAPANLQTAYDRDIKHLALQRIIAQNSTYKDSIVIPSGYQDTIRDGMAAIYNLTTVPQRDSVFDNYCIHQAITVISTDIYAGIDTSYTWTHNWQNLNTTTGIPALDNLLSTYGFSVTYYSAFANYVRLSTSQYINAGPLCDSMATFGGINYSEPDSYVGDGNRVEYSKNGTDRFYDFSIGYGDCPAGCTSRHTFKFKVDAGCSVTYLGIADYHTPSDVMPPPVNCAITGLNEKNGSGPDIIAFPNPATNVITISGTFSDLQDLEINVTDPLGKQLLQAKPGAVENRIELNIAAFESGMYFIQLFSKGKPVKVLRFIKE